MGHAHAAGQHGCRPQRVGAVDLHTQRELVEDEASDAIFWLVRGAALENPDGDADRGILVTLPPGVVQFLPKVPSGTRVISTKDNPAQRHLVTGGKRFTVSGAQLILAGQQGATVATVPRNGHLQIPDGGIPFFLGGLVVVEPVNNLPLDQLDITCVEQTTRVINISVLNRATPPRRITIRDAQFVDLDVAAGASVTTRPPSVPPNTIDTITVRTAPTKSGVFTGFLQVDCDDALVPQVRLPITLRAPALGLISQLEFDPAAIQVDARLAQGARAVVEVVNRGPLTPTSVGFSVGAGLHAALFSVQSAQPPATSFVPNVRVPLEVFFNPTEIGARDGAIEVRYGGIAPSGAAYSRMASLAVKGVGQASRIRLARQPPPRFGRFPSATSLAIDVGIISAPTANVATS